MMLTVQGPTHHLDARVQLAPVGDDEPHVGIGVEQAAEVAILDGQL